jgi:hypothetical protein
MLLLLLLIYLYLLNMDNNIFDFINNSQKEILLKKGNEVMNINKNFSNKLIFVYSGPKVGSTSIVSSLRIFGIDKFSVVHIHDEEMLKILGKINGITINEIILYNKYLGRDVYVIDIYRSPIERKISAYFEKIGSYHFNNTDEKMNTYNIQKVINRFNKIMPYLATGDHFIDKYNINIPENFDYINKYLLIEQNGIKYIKLRLKDSNLWGSILSKIFYTKIGIVKDYDSENKPIRDLYLLFKKTYSIPKNLLNEIIKCKYLNYFYSYIEIEEYYKQWNKNSVSDFTPYTEEQYKMYEELSIENSHIDYIQLNHYMDEGCICKTCSIKRLNVANKIVQGFTIKDTDRIQHISAKNEYLANQIIQTRNINKFEQRSIKKRKNFKEEMKNIVINRIQV